MVNAGAGEETKRKFETLVFDIRLGCLWISGQVLEATKWMGPFSLTLLAEYDLGGVR